MRILLLLLILGVSGKREKRCYKLEKLYNKYCSTPIPTLLPTTLPTFQCPIECSVKEGTGDIVRLESADWPLTSECSSCVWERKQGNSYDLNVQCSLNGKYYKNVCEHLCCYFNSLNSEPPANICNYWNLVGSECFLYG